MSPDDIPLLFRTRSRVRREELRAFLGEITKRVAKGRAVGCLIAGDAELQRLNREFRGKDYATDVLSFPAAKNGTDGLCGDLAISIDRARAQAKEYGHSVEDELRILMLHGALHLAGLDHETDGGEMARAEARWRKRFNLPLSLIERNGAHPEPRKNGAGGR